MDRDDFGGLLENFEPGDIEDDGTGVVDGADEDLEVDDDASNDEDPTVAELRASLAEANSMIKQLIKAQQGNQDGNQPPPEDKLEWTPQEFIPADADLSQLTPQQFNEILNTVAANAASVGADFSAKTTIKSIPNIVRHNVTVHATTTEAVGNFYKKNSDLLGFKKAVATVAQELAANNPEWDMATLFENAGKETRRRLNLPIPKKGKSSGNIPPVGQRRSAGSKPSALDAQISAMLNAK